MPYIRVVRRLAEVDLFSRIASLLRRGVKIRGGEGVWPPRTEKQPVHRPFLAPESSRFTALSGFRGGERPDRRVISGLR